MNENIVNWNTNKQRRLSKTGRNGKNSLLLKKLEESQSTKEHLKCFNCNVIDLECGYQAFIDSHLAQKQGGRVKLPRKIICFKALANENVRSRVI